MSKKLILILISSCLIFLILIATVIIVWARNKKAPNSPILPTTLSNIRAGEHKLALTQNGKLRTYTIYLPVNFDKDSYYPLVFSLHGGGSNASEQRSLNDLNKVSDKNNFIVAYPNAVGSNWNDGRAYTREKSDNSDDVGFIKLIIEKLGQWVNLDRSKIYSTGISNGGMMSLRLACEASETFAAVAPVAATMLGELKTVCSPIQTVSVLAILGTTDPLVPYDGGEIKGIAGRDTSDRGILLSANESFNFWINLNKCTAPAKVTNLSNTDQNDGTTSSQSLYETCEGGTQVGLITVNNGGHTWPGGEQYLGERLIGKTSRDFSASEVIWNFFKTNVRD